MAKKIETFGDLLDFMEEKKGTTTQVRKIFQMKIYDGGDACVLEYIPLGKSPVLVIKISYNSGRFRVHLLEDGISENKPVLTYHLSSSIPQLIQMFIPYTEVNTK